ncbi:hypothetical protein FRC12_001201 [Ceratobasidium sp. 428]|nr:hypothetical protein FRC12_001201 [Ceratobasidium sp. 428]
MPPQNDRLIRSHLNGGVTIDSRALLALLEAAPHWIIHRMTAMDNEERSSSVMLLVQLLRSSSCSAPEFQYAIGLSLAVAAVLVHNYPGWQHPLNSVEDRTARALEVYRYYKVEYHVEPKVLVASGLLGLFGLFRGVSEATTTFGKDEVTIITDVLTQIGNLRSGFRLHTLPDTITIMQDAKMTLLETLQAVADGRSDFGEIAVIPCLTQFLNRRALLGSDIHKAALGAFLGAQNSRLRRICSPLLLRGLSRFEYYLTDLEPAQLSGLIDISLGDDAYSAPTAMMCLWKLTGWLIEDPDEQLATVLADMLKHDAFTSLRAKAPDLPASPRNMFEVGFAEMWYPLLKEMTSHKYAASIVNGSRIVQRMRDDTDSAAESAVPYLEELRDGRSWDDILRELFHTSSSDSEI